MSPKPDKRPAVDWEKIELEFRAGQRSIREIGTTHGISHVAIMKRAKRDGWERNLAPAVREKVTARLVTEGVTGKSAAEIVELAAARDVQIIREHRTDIRQARSLTKEMIAELREATENRKAIIETIELETVDDKTAKRRAMMLRAVELPARSSVMVNLSSALKTLVGLERQAFNLDAPPEAQTVQVNNTTNILHVGGMSVEELEALEGALVKTIEGEKAE